MASRAPVLKIKISVGPFANGQTRVIEYAESLPVLLLNDRADLIRQFAELFERLEATLDENVGAPVALDEPSAGVDTGGIRE